MKEIKTKEKNKFKIFLTLIRIILIIIILYCLFYIFTWYKENKKNSDMLNRIADTGIIDSIVVEIPTNTTDDETNTESTQITAHKIDFKKLTEINNSIIGWINIPNTSIDYPVVQSSDNAFYLTHSFDKTRNSAGWIFADFRNRFDGLDKNIIIYGHNRMDSSMFATLVNTQQDYWYNNLDNKYITLTTPDGVHIYEIFSTYTIKKESYYITTDFTNDEEFLTFLNTLKSRSIHNFNVSLNTTDSILTLSTCDASGKSRVVVHAKKIT